MNAAAKAAVADAGARVETNAAISADPAATVDLAAQADPVDLAVVIALHAVLAAAVNAPLAPLTRPQAVERKVEPSAHAVDLPLAHPSFQCLTKPPEPLLNQQKPQQPKNPNRSSLRAGMPARRWCR